MPGIREVAERLCVCTATVYKLCASGALDSIRVPPADVAKYIRAEVQARLTGRARSL
jgi:hypothetical protein